MLRLHQLQQSLFHCNFFSNVNFRHFRKEFLTSFFSLSCCVFLSSSFFLSLLGPSSSLLSLPPPISLSFFLSFCISFFFIFFLFLSLSFFLSFFLFYFSLSLSPAFFLTSLSIYLFPSFSLSLLWFSLSLSSLSPPSLSLFFSFWRWASMNRLFYLKKIKMSKCLKRQFISKEPFSPFLIPAISFS